MQGRLFPGDGQERKSAACRALTVARAGDVSFMPGAKRGMPSRGSINDVGRWGDTSGRRKNKCRFWWAFLLFRTEDRSSSCVAVGLHDV